VTTCAAADARKAGGEDATGQEAIELAFNHRRHLATAAAELLDAPSAVSSNRARQRICLDVAGPIAER
jgi:hypothetical protein